MNGAADSNSGAPPAVLPDPVPTPAPATPAAQSPQTPLPHSSGCWPILKRIVATVYLIGATGLSLFFVSFATEGGGPVSAYLPTDHAALIHIKSGDAIWRGL
ncbi:MAG: hypothetical protein HY291_00880 [Planctomycetes bacterium]|nr:hypothetical protein [Planctomycetota bacterium]